MRNDSIIIVGSVSREYFMTKVRQAAVAGMFYPADKQTLENDVQHYLQQVNSENKIAASEIKAIIVPHAGYIYSGPVAASVYKQIAPLKNKINRVILIGPSHRVAFSGLAVPDSDIFNTPLGDIPIDQNAVAALSDLPQVVVSDLAHHDEHSLEVQLPFLQQILGKFTLVPLVVGDAGPNEVADVITKLWQVSEADNTLFVISTDLSHFHAYDEAVQRDSATSDAIVHLKTEQIHSGDACGCNGLNGMLKVAKEKNLSVELIDLRNSGDTAGDKSRVVGYGAYVIY